MNYGFTGSPWLENVNLDWSSIIKYGKEVVVKKGTFIHHEGEAIDSVYIIKKGRVQLSLLNEDGKEKTIAIIGENGLLGEYKNIDYNVYITSAKSVSNSRLIRIPKNTFENLLLKDNKLAEQRLELLTLKINLLAHSSLQLSYGNSSDRVIRMFIHLANSYGEHIEHEKVKITIPFTHQEVADLIGTTRVTVANVIKELVEKGLIEKKEGFYYLLNRDKLNKLL